MKFALKKVRYIPSELQQGVLYVSKEFGIAVHLCACRCGSRITTPLGPTEWSVRQTKKGPTLHPSVGNWREACQTHYWIREGEVRWAEKWSPEQIAAGRQEEERRTASYYIARGERRANIAQILLRWVRNVFGK
jgi:Family of unknown function (DUF6527)